MSHLTLRSRCLIVGRMEGSSAVPFQVVRVVSLVWQGYIQGVCVLTMRAMWGRAVPLFSVLVRVDGLVSLSLLSSHQSEEKKIQKQGLAEN